MRKRGKEAFKPPFPLDLTVASKETAKLYVNLQQLLLSRGKGAESCMRVAILRGRLRGREGRRMNEGDGKMGCILRRGKEERGEGGEEW